MDSTAQQRYGTRSPTLRRILREAAEMSKNPSPDYTASPLENDLFEWHFTLRGPPCSSFGEGIYHGRIVLPPTYPLRPPSFRFVTPSGRFEVNREICLSISGHHEETWQPAWGIRTALVALRSFMETDPKGQLGGLDSTDVVRKRLALESCSYTCPTCGVTNQEIIDTCEESYKASSSESNVDVEVPAELKMGWRDELKKSPESGSDTNRIDDGSEVMFPPPAPNNTQLNSRTIPSDEEDSETAVLAEGFVSTVQPALPSIQPQMPAASSLSGNLQPQLTSSRAIADNSRTASSHRPGQQHPATAAPQQSVYEGVPQWLDSVIILLFMILVSMILKVIVW